MTGIRSFTRHEYIETLEIIQCKNFKYLDNQPNLRRLTIKDCRIHIGPTVIRPRRLPFPHEWSYPNLTFLHITVKTTLVVRQ